MLFIFSISTLGYILNKASFKSLYSKELIILHEIYSEKTPLVYELSF